LQEDEEIQITAVGQNPLLANLDINSLRQHSGLILADVMSGRASALGSASKCLQHCPSFICRVLEINPAAVYHLPDDLRSNVCLISSLVLIAPLALAYVSPDVRGFVEAFGQTVREAMVDPTRLSTAPNEVTANRDVILEAVNQNGSALEYAAAQLKADQALVLAAVTREGSALKHAAAQLKSDRDFVLAAVKRNGSALQYAAAKLKADRDLVLVAVKRNGYALKYAAAELQSDQELLNQANFEERRNQSLVQSSVQWGPHAQEHRSSNYAVASRRSEASLFEYE